MDRDVMDRAELAGRDETRADRLCQVEEQMMMFSNNTDLFGALVAQLEDRLTSIVRQDVPSDGPRVLDPMEGVVGLADRMRDRNNDMGRYNDRLRSLLSRCEL